MRKLRVDFSLDTILNNIENMDIEGFKIFAKSNFSSPLPINENIMNAIKNRMAKENLTMDDLQ